MICQALRMGEATGFSSALNIVDCRSGQAISGAFARLFGAHGALLPALTILLTLYVAIFAVGLLTGRSRMGLSSLTPRVLTLGVALTFATSWAAYQNVVWTLAVGAPDELATLLTGSNGSATGLFARGLDRVFHIIAAAAQDQQARPAAPVPADPSQLAAASAFSGPSLLWLSAIILLLGTVGALITAKIALAGLLAVGPLFIILALFRSTWGLFEGWVKALVLLMLVPLFVVLIGGGALALIMPVISAAVGGQEEDTRRAAVMLLVAACIYSALIIMMIKMSATIVAGWRLPFASHARQVAERDEGPQAPAVRVPAYHQAMRQSPAVLDNRVRAMLSTLPPPLSDDRRQAMLRSSVIRVNETPGSAPATTLSTSPLRAAAIGRRFRRPMSVLNKDRLT